MSPSMRCATRFVVVLLLFAAICPAANLLTHGRTPLWICSLDIRPERGARRAWMQHGDLQQAQGKQTGRLRRDVFDLQLLQKRRALHFHGLLIMMGSGEVRRPRKRVGACQVILVRNDAGRRKPQGSSAVLRSPARPSVRSALCSGITQGLSQGFLPKEIGLPPNGREAPALVNCARWKGTT